ncbi:MAG: sulfotransferase family 2 domain-containing protein [Flavobacteriales bacterium]|nr:sulfotransferase family 2 domain-containing protein [Flavobacteriales bacterium]
MEDRNTIVFIHIPKTAGTTFHYILHNQYKGKKILTRESFKNKAVYDQMTDNEKRELKVIKGHYKTGIHEKHPNQVTYITFLRDPVKRTISEYNFMLLNREHPFHQTLMEKKLGLKELLKEGHIKNLDNSHTRFLAGVDDLVFGDVNEQTYQTALKNFDKFFGIFGIAERFDESLICIKRKLNWSFPFYVKANISDREAYVDQFDDETQMLLSRFNQYDQLLYEHACRKFDQIVTGYGNDFQEELKTFRRWNNIQSPFRRLVRSVWLTLRKLTTRN